MKEHKKIVMLIQERFYYIVHVLIQTSSLLCDYTIFRPFDTLFALVSGRNHVKTQCVEMISEAAFKLL